MSTAPAPIKIDRATRRCKFCRETGHDLRKCEKWAGKMRSESAPPDNAGYDVVGVDVRPFVVPLPEPERAPTGPDELVDAAAQLREEIDALEVEVAQYEAVRAELDKRIAKDKERLIVARAELVLLRGARRKRDAA